MNSARANEQIAQRPLEGRTAMVTGSSSGIGRATALLLAEEGADLILHGRAPSKRLDEVAQEIESLGRKTVSVYADFSQFDSFDQLVDQAWGGQNRIDIWINNAGADVLTGSWSDRALDEKLKHLWQVDVAAVLHLSRAAGRRMVEAFQCDEKLGAGHFSILNVGWDQACSGMEGDSGELFATTKGAVMSMTKSLAKSLAPAVRVNCIAPGWIKTAWGEHASEYWDQRAKSESLMGRWGKPEDVAGVAAFLVSERASFVSGQIVDVNGGFRG